MSNFIDLTFASDTQSLLSFSNFIEGQETLGMSALNHTSLLIKSFSLGLLVGSNSSRLFITREESAVTRDTCGCGNDTF